jgi:transposase
MLTNLVLHHVPDGIYSCGISAKQIQRETGVAYKSVWRMLRQIRTLMSEDLQIGGPKVEIDETYYGGVRKYGAGRPMEAVTDGYTNLLTG